MADDTYPDMTKVSRSVHGPRSIAGLVPVVARSAFNRSAPGIARLVENWAGIVGPVLAEATVPRQLAQRTLTIGCSGPVAMELQHLTGELIGRVNQYFGSQTVHRLRFLQTAAPRTGHRPKPHLTEAARMKADEAVANMPEGPLRSALAGLGQAVLSESASRLGKQPRTRC
jgi:hypothetical protein